MNISTDRTAKDRANVNRNIRGSENRSSKINNCQLFKIRISPQRRPNILSVSFVMNLTFVRPKW